MTNAGREQQEHFRLKLRIARRHNVPQGQGLERFRHRGLQEVAESRRPSVEMSLGLEDGFMLRRAALIQKCTRLAGLPITIQKCWNLSLPGCWQLSAAHRHDWAANQMLTLPASYLQDSLT